MFNGYALSQSYSCTLFMYAHVGTCFIVWNIFAAQVLCMGAFFNSQATTACQQRRWPAWRWPLLSRFVPSSPRPHSSTFTWLTSDLKSFICTSTRCGSRWLRGRLLCVRRTENGMRGLSMPPAADRRCVDVYQQVLDTGITT